MGRCTSADAVAGSEVVKMDADAMVPDDIVPMEVEVELRAGSGVVARKTLSCLQSVKEAELGQ